MRSKIKYTPSLLSWVDAQIQKLGGPGSGNHGHKGRPGQVGGSDDDGVPNASSYKRSVKDKLDPEIEARLAKPTKLKQWKSDLAKLGGKGDRRAWAERILKKTGYRYEDRFPSQDGETIMYTRGRWNIFVDYMYNTDSTKVTLKDSHQGN